MIDSKHSAATGLHTNKEYLLSNESDLDAVVDDVYEMLSRLGKEVEGGLVLALQGDLGAGKTTFTKKLAAKLGITENLTSPTFVILKKYPISPEVNMGAFPFNQLVHIDAYRLNSGEELRKLGFDSLIKNSSPKSLICLEWPELVADILPEQYLSIKFEHIMDSADSEQPQHTTRRKVTVSLKV